MTIKKVLPEEMKGRGSPVIGTSPMDIATFMYVWAKIKVAKPREKSLPLSSEEQSAIQQHGRRSMAKSEIRTREPKNPVSSAHTQKMKSFIEIACGRYLSAFISPLPIPHMGRIRAR